MSMKQEMSIKQEIELHLSPLRKFYSSEVRLENNSKKKIEMSFSHICKSKISYLDSTNRNAHQVDESIFEAN